MNRREEIEMEMFDQLTNKRPRADYMSQLCREYVALYEASRAETQPSLPPIEIDVTHEQEAV